MSEFSLTHYDAMRQAIVQAHSIDEVKDIRDKAEALRQYARQSRCSIDDINRIAQIKLRAERRGGELLAEIPPAQGKRTDLTSSIVEEVTRAEAIEAAGLSVGAASRWQMLAELPEPVFDEHINAVVSAGEELTTNYMQRKVQEFRRGEKRAAMAEPGAFPEGIFRVWYADPPWQMNDNGVKTAQDNYGVAERHYPTMSTPDICAKGQEWAEHIAKDAVCFMWATVPMLPDGLVVMAAWGFVYKTHFVWDKHRHNWGHYSSVQHEVMLLGTRGSCLPDIDEQIRSIQEFPRGEHSAKPEEFRQLIDTLYPYGPRVECFARGKLPEHWQGWGNQAVAA
jgi:N6-adenosine-specific RNA methylase IME4